MNSLLIVISIAIMSKAEASYVIGAGISDITGPVAEINMMGYANPSQINNGIHTRLFSRAFIIQETSVDSPIVFVSIDHGMTAQIVKTEVCNRLRKLFGDRYTRSNVMISATHTHSGPAGFFQYLLYVITSEGFIRQSYDALVDGIVESIVMAHESRKPGKILYNRGDLFNCSINRSPLSYLANPLNERSQYNGDVDTEMTVLKLIDHEGSPIGMINWFAVHGVSMNNTNTLTSSDNKGLAAILFESDFNGVKKPLGKGPFVAAFAQANEGDVSPNTAGPRCIDTGLPCDGLHSTCGGRVEKCIASGPGRDMFESTRIIGQKQYHMSRHLYDTATEELVGPVHFIHQNIDMSDRSVTYMGKHLKPVTGRTCKPAMGYSFAAGTTDGPGAFDFKQGMRKGTAFWNMVRNFLRTPSPEMQACQAPKPILLALGEMHFPYDWVPRIVETQVFRVGQLFIAGMPGEFTTMSGRRIKKSVLEKVPKNSKVVIAGLSNVYTDYIATYEEYQVQRYEGASTIFGPHTLLAYLNQYSMLTEKLVANKTIPAGPEPPFFVDKLISLKPGVVFDTHPFNQPFGTVLVEAKPVYDKRDDVVRVEFVSANPRNDMHLKDTYLTVERKTDSGLWWTEYTDAHWETKFTWLRSGFLDKVLGRSKAVIEWSVTDIRGICRPGTYRIGHKGTSKSITQKLSAFSGHSKEFQVKCAA